MAFERLEFTKSWENPQDFPTYEQSEAQVRADLQLLHEETRQGINRLVDALNDSAAAAQLPFSGEGLNAETVQEAILETYAATKQAAAGQIVDGSVGKEKLSQEVLDRCYGGRPWVSMDLPEGQMPADGFPVGQLWLRPAFTVDNLAAENWTVSGGAAASAEHGWVLTGNGETTQVQLRQTMTGLGLAGDAVTVVLRTSEADSQLTALTLYLNGAAYDLLHGSVFSTQLDDTGALQVVVSAQWPAAALAVGSVTLTDWTVVNTAALERELSPAAPVADWNGLITGLLPLQTAQLPRCLYQQVRPGRWEQVAWQVLPVSQGGTGLTQLPEGGLLCGGGDRVTVLDMSQTDGLLRLRGGKPVWEPLETAMTEAKTLRLASGSYVGNGKTRTIALPVVPQFLLIWDSQNNTVLLAKDSIYNCTLYYTGGYYDGTVTLYGSELSVYNTNGTDQPVNACNVSGTTYNWLAVVEVGA